MNIQLLLEDQEVELTNNIIFPLNKTFENLSNPTDIVVEYSKSINIPMTQKNNDILGHAYNINRTIVEGGSVNIGLYFDPNKRIPFKLIFNGGLLMEGYAKFTSANYSTKNKYYTLNLYGALGDVFHKLKEVGVEGDDPDYVLDDHCTQLEDNIFDSGFVQLSFNVDNPVLNINNAHPYEIIGMAPAYRGLYPNFKSDQKYSTVAGEGNTEGFKTFASELRDKWKDKYALLKFSTNYVFLTDAQKQQVDTYIDGLDPEGAIGDGLADNQVHEYRSYQQRPYIYFNKLMQMYQEKCLELTGYTLNLDPYWFNPNNPYWTRSCYMLDFLTADGVETYAKEQISPYSSGFYTSKSGRNRGSSTLIMGSIRKGSTNRFDLSSFTLNFHHDYTITDMQRATSICNEYSTAEHKYNTVSKYLIYIRAYPLDSGGNYNPNNYATKKFWTAANPYEAQEPDDWGADNYTPLTVVNSIEKGPKVSQYYQWVKANLDSSCVVPASSFTSYNYRYGAYVEVIVQCDNPDEDFTSVYCSRSTFPILQPTTYAVSVQLNSSSASLISGPIYYTSNNVSSVPVRLSNVWKRDDPPFNVILEYTKMFGLVWSIDYAAKTILITPRGRYFEGYTVEKWDDKLDRSKDFIIEPVVFPSKYIEFNYEKTDGYRYKAYREKYNNEYGGLRIKTNYDFNTENEPLFEGINPSMSSNRNIIHYTQLRDWDLVSVIKGVPDLLERMECADNDNKKELNMSNWYLRGANVYTSDMPYRSYVSDDNSYMIEHDNYCYYDEVWHNNNDPFYELQSFPVFSGIYRDGFATNTPSYGILFNQPNEDYTTNKVYTEANKNYIFDLFWSKYINERYNIQNKKLTAYFHISPSEYFDFKFNKFITIQDQLFCVNKIFDYNVQSTEATKVELIQITDPENYANTDNLFDPITTTISQYSRVSNASSGSFTIGVRSMDVHSITDSIPPQTPNTLINEDVEIVEGGWKEYTYYWEIPASGNSILTTITFECEGFTKEVVVSIRRT